MGEEVKKLYLYVRLPVPLYSLFGDLRMAAVTRTAEEKKDHISYYLGVLVGYF
jgi:hypothetical protein